MKLEDLKETRSAVVYQDMAGDGGEFIAFNNKEEFEIYIDGQEFLGIGSAYPGGARSTLELTDIPAEKVVPKDLLVKLNNTMDTDDTHKVDKVMDQINDYYFYSDD